MRTLLLFLLASVFASSAVSLASEPKPRVLILGDSISIGYTPFVQQALAEEAVVVRPMRGEGAENCAGTTNGLKHIDRWLAIDGGKWDVIHFNFGLHDMKHVDARGQNSNDPNHGHQAPPELYAKQLNELVVRMKATGATLLFATTTPVPTGGVKPYRDVNDPQRYNAIAVEIMKEHKVGVNDLYEFARPRLEKIQQPVNVHFTNEGSQVLAQQVVEKIQLALTEREAAGNVSSK